MFLGFEALLVPLTDMHILAIMTFQKTPFRKNYLCRKKCPIFPYIWKSMTSLRKTVFERICCISGHQYDSASLRVLYSLNIISGQVLNALVT